jgi:hypothetical protein
MLIYRDNEPVPSADAAGGDVEDWVARWDERGVRLAGDPLAPDGDARAVRVRSGETKVSDNAFQDTGGALIGYDLLDCTDLDQAITVAAEHPLAARFVMELRPAVGD